MAPWLDSEPSSYHELRALGPLVGSKGPRAAQSALLLLVLIALLAIGLPGNPPRAFATSSPQSSRLPLPYAGVDYYDPSDYFTHCADFSWLQNHCYNNPANPDPPRKQLISDLRFVNSQDLGGVQRVWISLDQLMRWSRSKGFIRFIPGVLHHVDNMLRIYHRFGLKVVLVLYVYDGGDWLNQFRPQALDGQHETMRRNYLLAESRFIRHLASRPLDVQTAPIVELATEPYYQLERYFNDPAKLGSFTRCASESQSNWGCVDRRIIHPWLADLYRTARHASHAFLYTFSDTGRLFEDYSYWRYMYPQDVIDEHLYDDAPWTHPGYYRRAREFRQPWFASEVGCASGNVACTYGGIQSTPVDRWWLAHLRGDGAEVVLVECHVTLWLYPDGPDSQIPTPTGSAVEAVSNEALQP